MKRALILLTCLLGGLIASAQNIDRFEVFWDVDPGIGNGISYTVVPGTSLNENIEIDPSGLKAGTHVLGVRAHRDDGTWGVPMIQKVYVREIVAAEYFWDVDPGIGMATPIAVTSTDFNVDEDLLISSEGVPGGRHVLGVRTLNVGGFWSPTHYKVVTVGTEYLEGEYFWDTDPGHGNATSFALPDDENSLDANVTVDNSGLLPGRHTLYTRVRGTGGSYGPTHAQDIYISRVVVGAEYFWDTDPGVGNGTPIGTISIGTTAQVCDDVSTVGLDRRGARFVCQNGI